MSCSAARSRTSGCSRNATSSAAAGLLAGGRARVRDQARPHARGRLREPAEGCARAPPCRLRRLARTQRRGPRRARAAARATTTRRRSARGPRSCLARSRRAGRAAARARRSSGRAGPPTRPSAATRSTKAWPCCTGRSSWSRTPAAGEIWQAIGHANALKFDGPPFREAMEKAIELGGPPAELYTELALQTVRRSGNVDSRDMIPSSSTGGWNARSSSRRKALPPIRRRSPHWRCGRRTRMRHARSKPSAERLGDDELRSTRACGAHRGGVAIRRPRSGSRRGRRAPRAARRDLSAGRPPFRSHAGYRGQSRPGQAVRGREPSSQLTEMVEGLTAHHRLHGIHMRLRVEALAGRWDAVRPLTATRSERLKRTRPLPVRVTSGAPSLCARERAVRRRRPKPAGSRCTPTRSGSRARRNLTRQGSGWHLFSTTSPRSGDWSIPGARRVRADGSSTGGGAARCARRPRRSRADRVRRPGMAEAGDVLEPFALRALGVARSDAQLLGQAAARFAAMHLEWHAAETRKLLS